jgi:hypothetical protein
VESSSLKPITPTRETKCKLILINFVKASSEKKVDEQITKKSEERISSTKQKPQTPLSIKK